MIARARRAHAPVLKGKIRGHYLARARHLGAQRARPFGGARHYPTKQWNYANNYFKLKFAVKIGEKNGRDCFSWIAI